MSKVHYEARQNYTLFMTAVWQHTSSRYSCFLVGRDTSGPDDQDNIFDIIKRTMSGMEVKDCSQDLQQ